MGIWPRFEKPSSCRPDEMVTGVEGKGTKHAADPSINRPAPTSQNVHSIYVREPFGPLDWFLILQHPRESRLEI